MILNKIKSPFDSNISGEKELKITLTTMRDNNEFLYKSIVSYLPTQIKDKLRDLLATNTIDTDGQASSRKILKITGVKKT